MTLLRRALLAALAGTTLLLVYLWLTMLSPFFYDPPDSLGPVAEGSQRVFVYGTLRYGAVRWLVYDRWGKPVDAALMGYQRRGTLDLKKAPTAELDGLVLTVSAEELRDIDRYERLGIRYQRVRAVLSNDETVWVYRRLRDRAAQ